MTARGAELVVLVDATMLDGGHGGAATRLAALGAAHAARGVVSVLHLVRPGIDPLPGLNCAPLAGMHTPLRRALAGRRIDAELARHGGSVWAAAALPLPNVLAAPMTATLHDLRFLQDGEDVTLARRLWGRRRLAPNLARAAAVVAVSRFTATELARHAVCAADRVQVIPNAGSPGVMRVDDSQAISALRRRLQWNARYVLAIGPLERHKRPLFLLEALASARARPGGGDLGLVLAGRAEPAAAQTFARRATELGVQDCVRLTGPLDDGQLSVALSGADALLLASECEGFSIPVVDAQRCGVPVVAVSAGAVPEVAGAGAWLVPPGDAAAAGAALVDAVSPGAERERRLALGRELSARWSWERSAEQLEALWLRLAAARRARGA